MKAPNLAERDNLALILKNLSREKEKEKKKSSFFVFGIP